MRLGFSPRLAALLAVSLAATACSSSGSPASLTVKTSATATPSPAPSSTATASASSSTPYTCPAATTSSGPLDCTSLPLGDQKYSTTTAAVGSVYLCNATGSRGPVVTSAPWLDTAAKTWNVLTKIAVAGAVAWSGNFSATLASGGTTRIVTSDGLPVSPYLTGTFPIASTDPAYAYDHNPNSIASQSFSFTFAEQPTANATPTCLPSGGIIGITTTGVAIYNAFDANGYDGAAREIQDACHGHPDPSSTYHYHGFIQTCSGDVGSTTQNSSLIGYGLDGFGIYGPWYDGKVLTSADLDVCHGTTSVVMWDGAPKNIYHYVSTFDFPYTIGCYRGTPVQR